MQAKQVRVPSSAWQGPTVAYSDADGSWSRVEPRLSASLPLVNVNLGVVTTLSSLPLNFQPRGSISPNCHPVALHLFTFSSGSLMDYKTRVAPALSAWLRQCLERKTQWFIFEASEFPNDEVLSACRQEFHSHFPGDRLSLLGKETSATWVTTVKNYTERGFLQQSQELEEELISASPGGESAETFSRLFSARDRYACLYESFGVWGEAFRQYAEIESALDKFPQASPAQALPTGAASGLTKREAWAAREAVAAAGSNVDVDDVRRYLFARKSHFLFMLNRPAEVIWTGLSLIRTYLTRADEAAAKQWGINALWEVTSYFRASFGEEFENPGISRADASRVSSLVAEALHLLIDLLLDTASAVEGLASSHVWALRDRSANPHRLLWDLTPPAIAFLLERGHAGAHDAVSGTDATSWLSACLESTERFEDAYEECLRLLIPYLEGSRRARLSVLVAHELCDLAFRRGHYVRVLHTLTRPTSHATCWPSLRWRRNHYMSLCFRQIGDNASYFSAGMSLLDECGKFQDASFSRAAADIADDLGALVFDSDASLPLVCEPKKVFAVRGLCFEATCSNKGGTCIAHTEVGEAVECFVDLVSALPGSLFRVSVVDFHLKRGEEECCCSCPVSWTLEKGENFNLAACLKCDRSGEYAVVGLTLYWGHARMRVGLAGSARLPSLEVQARHPSCFLEHLFAPNIVVRGGDNRAACQIRNTDRALASATVRFAVRGRASLGTTFIAADSSSRRWSIRPTRFSVESGAEVDKETAEAPVELAVGVQPSS